LANHIEWAESKVERVQELVLEEVDALLRCPVEDKEQATQEILSKLEPRLRGALDALDTIRNVRELTEEELVRRGAFMMLLDTASLTGHG
jgi:hypothetical protein